MKTLAKRMASLLTRRWVWTLCLLLMLVLAIWFAGPYLALGDYRPWASETSRLLTACILMLSWGLSMALAGRPSISAPDTEDVSQQEHSHQALIIDAEKVELQSRYKEALRTIKGSTFYGGRSERWRNDLPWYLVIGPEQSGKTSLLDFSGLEFPLNRGDQQRLTRDIGGTRHADWYFADNAVLIDTAGRYLTQPETHVDGAGWSTLLDLLRKRRARPLNGVLVTLPVELLVAGHEVELETLARQVRQRLLEIHQCVGVEVPVYLVLSKADRLKGFDEFFDQLSREESDQVLGASFGKDQNGTEALVVKQAFEILLQRLNSQVIVKMHQERDIQRRGSILDFPHGLGNIGEPLCLFIELAFSGNRYQRASQLRGFYFTSAPHLDGQLHETTAGIGRNIGLATGRLPTLRRGRARFIHHLLSRVIFPEAELATLDQHARRRIGWSQRALYAGAAACLVLFGCVWAFSFSSNHQRLEQLRDLAQGKERQLETLGDGRDGTSLLEVLDSSYAAAQVFPTGADVQYREHSGLYQGDKVAPVVAAAYRQDLEERLLPLVAAQLESQIRAYGNDRERLLNSLRAYLMLGLQERRDPAFLKDWIAAEWSVQYPGNAVLQNGLASHFERLLSQPFRSYTFDASLVAQARQTLRGESLANVVYRMIREQARQLPDYRLDGKLGTQSALFIGADYVIPGLYTRHGYQTLFAAQGVGLVKGILGNNWVLGESESLSPKDLTRLMAEVEQLYFQDYANHWGDALAQLSMQPIGDINLGSQQLAGLTSANSPLVQVLIEVRDNTLLSGPVDAASEAIAHVPNGTGNKLAKATDALAAAATSLAVPDTSRRTLANRFQPLHRLLDEGDAPAMDLANALQALNALQLQLAGLAHSGAPEQAAYDMARARMGGERDAFHQVRTVVTRLPQPVGAWLTLLAEESWTAVLNDAHQYLNQRYKHELYAAYDSSLKKRYPFAAHSESDVAVADFREFFKTQGTAQTFFDNYLKPFVNNASGQYQLRRVDGRGLPLSRAFLSQLTRVQTIRASFFAENPNEPQVQFKLEPYSLDSSVGRADFQFGDRQMEYRHGPIVQTAFQWPSTALEGRTSLVVEELSGRKVGIEKNTGPWSLFRLLDLMTVDYHSGRDVLILKANLGGLHANYLLHSQRSPNPFDIAMLRGFELPASL
ncbi:type VI secretion system membrane subunit TssM [Pseudomonas matsuisoli]|uniref:Type VI secretion protein VasK n=1 Tax=Pseudomonas matsuisoli TaxID=1515666 RepID=A0A917PS23_9PSED|nr:type VI secretion system membrane subunit TssM [Pseudomonas matsuisoli]GGJ89271.1 type VI secretion protein VasK [Pseudomonas matsuisoli]